MAGQIIHFDYGSSPYGQKTKLLLAAAGVSFQRCDQPVVLPRPDLEALGITYRRIPLLAVGKDVYCDTSLIFDIVVSGPGKGKVATSTADKAWEAYGRETFLAALTLLPDAIVDDEDFVRDRETIFPVLKRPDYKSLRPSGLAELISRLTFIENTLLASSPFVAGEKPGVADIHIMFGVRWALFDRGVQNEKGVGRDTFPRVWKLIECLPAVEAETISSDAAIEAIKGAQYSDKEWAVQAGDSVDIAAEAAVTVESFDSTPGSHPQAGKLIGLTPREIVLELDSGVHLHFPREGYILRKA